MDQNDKLRAQQIIEQLKGQQAQNFQGGTYEPQEGDFDNQNSAAGVETEEIPGIGVVYKGANVSTNTNPENLNEIKPAGGLQKCPQCGTFHPPLKSGQDCPVAPVEIEDKSGKKQKVDLTKYLDMLRGILKAQLEQKEIEDPDHFMKYLVVEITKATEKYKGKQ